MCVDDGVRYFICREREIIYLPPFSKKISRGSPGNKIFKRCPGLQEEDR
jgi:hypothetical protein